MSNGYEVKEPPIPKKFWIFAAIAVLGVIILANL
jgi:hypothetical protein